MWKIVTPVTRRRAKAVTKVTSGVWLDVLLALQLRPRQTRQPPDAVLVRDTSSRVEQIARSRGSVVIDPQHGTTTYTFEIFTRKNFLFVRSDAQKYLWGSWAFLGTGACEISQFHDFGFVAKQLQFQIQQWKNHHQRNRQGSTRGVHHRLQTRTRLRKLTKAKLRKENPLRKESTAERMTSLIRHFTRTNEGLPGWLLRRASNTPVMGSAAHSRAVTQKARIQNILLCKDGFHISSRALCCHCCVTLSCTSADILLVQGVHQKYSHLRVNLDSWSLSGRLWYLLLCPQTRQNRFHSHSEKTSILWRRNRALSFVVSRKRW